jgi:hypothetical protein
MKRTLLALALLMGVAAEPAFATELGVYEGPGCTGAKEVPVFDKWLGKPVVRALDFNATNSWPILEQTAGWVAQCWSHAKLGIKMTFAVPMLINDKSATLALGAAGNYDSYFTQLGEIYVKNGYPDAILRVGWEFNGGWYRWAAKQDPTSWVGFFRHIVTALRAAPGNHFQIDWNPAIFMQQIAPDKVYPGDAYVDIIGVDAYDQFWGPQNIMDSPQLRWKAYLEYPYGLNWITQFAAEHHKPISVPEWGVTNRTDGHGGGDDPYFVQQMAAWFTANNVLYQDYFDFNMKGLQYKISTGLFPNSAAEYIKLFGP